MEKEQCRFHEPLSERCTMKASKDKAFCALHQRRFARVPNEELMREISNAARSYIREAPEIHQAVEDPLGLPDKVPLLFNLITEALDRGYRYKDLKHYLKKHCDDWHSWRDVRKIKHI